MKLNKTKLQRIIKEELTRFLTEQPGPAMFPGQGAGIRAGSGASSTPVEPWEMDNAKLKQEVITVLRNSGASPTSGTLDALIAATTAFFDANTETPPVVKVEPGLPPGEEQP